MIVGSMHNDNVNNNERNSAENKAIRGKESSEESTLINIPKRMKF